MTKKNIHQKKSNIDGAILTLTGYFNYGNVIQRYALQKFLQKKGYNFVSYIDTISDPNGIYRISINVKLKTPLRAAKRFLKTQKPYWYVPGYSDLYSLSSNRDNIIRFVNKYIYIKAFNPDDKYNNYIVGSDQVWRDWWNDSEKIGYYFLNFLKERKVNKIAYAVSFGKDKIYEIMNQKTAKYLDKYIRDFDHISVREKSAEKVIKETWGLDNINVVLDPSLLLEQKDYSRLIEDSEVKYDQIQPIFTYILGETPDIKNFIRKIQDIYKLSTTNIRAHEGADNDLLPAVEFWLKGFRDSRLVITNSFHGMMLSIINNTEFIIISRDSGGISRIVDFLYEYDLGSRLVQEKALKNFDIDNLNPINWDRVNKKIKKQRSISSDWLINSLH